MKIAVLSNDNLNPWINWTTLGPPFLEPLGARPGNVLVKPPPIKDALTSRASLQLFRTMWAADAVFWMQGSSRPELPLSLTSLMAGRARRSAFVVDPWRSVLPKLALAARMQRLDPLFVSFREAALELRRSHPRGRFEWLPFGIDTRFFHPRAGKKDVFIFWMGRRYEPLHQAILQYCQDRQLKYVYRQKGVSELLTPADLGAMAARAAYFVVTPPDLDNPVKTGGFSPLVMRYMEGLAAGARLVGVLPRSGEYERLLPTDALLQVAPDGSDFTARMDADRADDGRHSAVERASAVVLREHSWARRAEQVMARLADGTVAFPL